MYPENIFRKRWRREGKFIRLSYCNRQKPSKLSLKQDPGSRKGRAQEYLALATQMGHPPASISHSPSLGSAFFHVSSILGCKARHEEGFYQHEEVRQVAVPDCLMAIWSIFGILNMPKMSFQFILQKDSSITLPFEPLSLSSKKGMGMTAKRKARCSPHPIPRGGHMSLSLLNVGKAL